MGRHGESIWKRQDGRWEARVITGHDSSGKAKYRYYYGKTYSEAKEKKRRAESQTASLSTVSCHYLRITVAQAAEEWLAHQTGSIKETTYVRYKNLLENQILPSLGTCRISMLTSARLEQFFKEKLENGKLKGTGGLSPKYVADMRAVLIQVFDFAREQGHVALPFRVPPVPVRSEPVCVLTRSEQKRLENVLFSSHEPVCMGILPLLVFLAALCLAVVVAALWKWNSSGTPSGSTENHSAGTIEESEKILASGTGSADPDSSSGETGHNETQNPATIGIVDKKEH